MVSKLFEHRQFDGARGGAFQLPGRWTDPLGTASREWPVQTPLSWLAHPPDLHLLLLPLQHPSPCIFASNRDQDVLLAAVNAAYRTRAIARSLEVSSLLDLTLKSFYVV